MVVVFDELQPKNVGRVFSLRFTKGVLVWDRGKGRAVCELSARIQTALVCCHKRCAVGPIIVSIGGAIDGKDDVHMSMRLNERMERYVLKILAAIDECKAPFLGIFRGGIVITVERIGRILCDIVVVLAYSTQDLGHESFGDLWNGGCINLEEKLIE